MVCGHFSISQHVERIVKQVWVQASLMFVLIGTLSGGALCAKPQPDGSQAIQAVLMRQQAAWNRGDVDAFMQDYWNSAETEFVGENGILRGWQAVHKRYLRSYPDRAAMGQLQFSNLRIKLLCAGAGLATGQWHLKRGGGDLGGVFTLVFRRFPSGWKIVSDHTSRVKGY